MENKMKSMVKCLGILMLTFLSWQCSKDNNSDNDIILDKTELNMQMGQKDSLIATFLSGTIGSRNVSWESNEPEIVQVDENGRLTALSIGNAVITASNQDGSKKATCAVRVMGFARRMFAMEKGSSITLELLNLPSDVGAVTWKSSHPEMVSVNASGLSESVSTGCAFITASVKSLGITFKCQVASCDEVVYAGDIPIPMIKVEGGTFLMGAQHKDKNEPNYDPMAENDESPVHEVTLSDYYICQFEVTQELWVFIKEHNPSKYQGDLQQPVEKVKWQDDVCEPDGFLDKLNALTGKNFVLPTEAQWEFAARGGNLSHGYIYSGSANPDDVCWHNSKSTHPVGEKMPNELGIYDMSGNVYEMCYDSPGLYHKTPQTDPLGPEQYYNHVVRGGSIHMNEEYSRVTFRHEYVTDYMPDPDVGLRLAYSGN